jgi:hypothetical protein
VRSPNAIEPEPKNVLPNPGSLTTLRGHIGKTYFFRVTGAIQGGIIWGTDMYTLDSRLATAAVHAGVLKPGATGIVKVKILDAQPAFQGSTRFGITSNSYPGYPGAYLILK